MSAPHIHHLRGRFSVSDALDLVGDDLSRIRHEDKLTWTDMGLGLGKCKDRAQDYAKALSEMPFTTLLLGYRAWGDRLGGGALAMVNARWTPLDLTDAGSCDRSKESSVLKAALALSVALLDGKITNEEITANRETIQNARDALDALLMRPKVRVAG